MQKQPIQGADLKKGDGGGGDMCLSVCVCIGGGVDVGRVTTIHSLVASNGEQART